jgi:hypothetical protein
MQIRFYEKLLNKKSNALEWKIDLFEEIPFKGFFETLKEKPKKDRFQITIQKTKNNSKRINRNGFCRSFHAH